MNNVALGAQVALQGLGIFLAMSREIGDWTKVVQGMTDAEVEAMHDSLAETMPLQIALNDRAKEILRKRRGG